MKLTRPIVVIDLETTGTSVYSDRIVEICLAKYFPDGSPESHVMRVKPCVQIPPEATAIHGISNPDVAHEPTFGERAPAILSILDGCDLAGFNVRRFDLPLLEEEFRRAGHVFNWRDRAVVDAYLLWVKMEPRDLAGAVRTFCGRAHEGAHGAWADAMATWDVLLGMIERPGWNVPEDVAAISEICDPPDPDRFDPDGKLRWVGDELTIAFGKCKGMTLAALARSDRGMLLWILGKDFSPEVKGAVKTALDGRPILRAKP